MGTSIFQFKWRRNILLLSVGKTGTILFNLLLAGESNVLQLIFFFLKIQMTYDDNLTFL